MKKIYFSLIFVLAVSVNFAQVKNPNRVHSLRSTHTNTVVKEKENRQLSSVGKPIKISTKEVVKTSFAGLPDAVNARRVPAADLIVEYGRPDGTFFEGLSRNFGSWNELYLHSPAIIPVDYYLYSNASNVTFEWYYGNTSDRIEDPVDADGTLHFAAGITPSNYVSYLPRVTATTATKSKSFIIGEKAEDQFLMAASVDRYMLKDGTNLGETNEFSALTLANLYGEDGDNLYGGFSESEYFGSGYSNDDGDCVGILQIIPQLKSPLYIESVSILAYQPSAKAAVPAGGVMKLEFYYLNTDGTLGKKIAESTTNKFVQTASSMRGGVFMFTFEEEEDGFIINSPVTLGTEGEIAVFVTGFNSTWNIRFLFGGADGWWGSAYTLHGEDMRVGTFGYLNDPDIPYCDLYFQFNGIFNCLVPYQDYGTIEFPEEGGWAITEREGSDEYNDYALFSSYNLDEYMTDVWIESAPDWVDGFDIDTEYFEDYNIVFYYFSAEELPAELSGRSGNIVLGSYGVTVNIPVIQGDGGSGISLPKIEQTSVVRKGNDFILKYPSTANSVALYNIAGQKVNEYKLNASGTYTLPASDLQNGVYILKFDGSNAVIKILK